MKKATKKIKWWEKALLSFRQTCITSDMSEDKIVFCISKRLFGKTYIIKTWEQELVNIWSKPGRCTIVDQKIVSRTKADRKPVLVKKFPVPVKLEGSNKGSFVVRKPRRGNNEMVTK